MLHPKLPPPCEARVLRILRDTGETLSTDVIDRSDGHVTHRSFGILASRLEKRGMVLRRYNKHIASGGKPRPLFRATELGLLALASLDEIEGILERLPD